MPGIVGLISKLPSEICREKLSAMLGSMNHERFYSSGIYFREDLGVYLGWTAHENSPANRMPVLNQSEETCVILSGEDLGGGESFGRIPADPQNSKEFNRTYLVALYEKEGLKLVEKLNGWFCGVVVDLRKRIVALFNDRYGMHRIFVYESGDSVYFASEAKALLAVLPEIRCFDPKGVGEFLTCDCTLESNSLYKGLDILPGGTVWIAEEGKITRRYSYFDSKEWAGQEQLGERELLGRSENLILDVVKKYSGGSFPLGVSITGGLDSRIVMACLDKTPEKFRCYTFGSMYRDTFDVHIGREVAHACGLEHRVLVLGEEFINKLPSYLERAVQISDGYIGFSGAAELYVNSLARKLSHVRLTGNYGGELLRGHRAFKWALPQGEFVKQELQPYLVGARKTFQKMLRTDSITFAMFRQAPAQGHGRLAIEGSQIVPRTPFMDKELVRLAYQAPPHMLQSEFLSWNVISRYRPELLKISTDRGSLPDGRVVRNLIRQAERRFFIKGEYWASHGMPNWLAAISGRKAVGVVEKAFLGRNKFQHFRSWSQNHFLQYVRDVLAQGAKDLKDFFDPKKIEVMVDEHMRGRRNYVNEIDQLMSLSLAYRAFLKPGN